MAFLDARVAAGDDASVRRALQPLALLADKHNCVIILLRHLNKNPARGTLYRGAGATASGLTPFGSPS